MARFMGKFKDGNWEEIDKTNPDSKLTDKKQMLDTLKEYQDTFGRSWLFKWVDDNGSQLECPNVKN